MTSVPISTASIGSGEPCFVLAEAGVNHNGNIDLACELICAAAQAGANAVKFQTFRADQLATATAPKAAYQVSQAGCGESQLEMLRRLELPLTAYARLQRVAQDNNVLFLSSPFDEESADMLEKIGVAAFKIPSGELTNHPFLAHVAAKRKPLIISTGMASMGDVDEAVAVVRGAGNDQVVLLHCVSSYPAPPSEINLLAMETMRRRFGVPVGFSDHTSGVEIPLAAAALGAAAIEKHITIDRTLEGPDHGASLEPAEFAEMVRSVRNIELALGNGEKRPAPCELDCARVARKSLVARCAIAPGERLTVEKVSSMRPGTGIPPSRLELVIGRVACQPIAAGELITVEAFA